MTVVNQIPETQKLKLSVEQNTGWPGSPKIIWEIRADIITLLIQLHIFAIAIRAYCNVKTARKVLYALVVEKKRIFKE